MKIVVSFSGGKDSHASLLWAVDKYGAKNVTAVFADTGWEHKGTYSHITRTCAILQVELVIIKSKKYDGFVDLAKNKKRFPSATGRFCTEELKIKPMIDWVLSQTESLTIVQGIRGGESRSRAKMNKECRFFKYYFEPYNKKGKRFTYRAADVMEWTKQYADDIIRPMFDMSGQEVIDYILGFGHQPNPLYYSGFSRVGCFPCIMSTSKDISLIANNHHKYAQRLIDAEDEVGSTFFSPDDVPLDIRRGRDPKTGKRIALARDVLAYRGADPGQTTLHQDDGHRCMSFYGLCE